MHLWQICYGQRKMGFRQITWDVLSSPKMFQKCRIVADYEVLKWFFQKRLIKTLQNNDFFTVFGSFW